MDKFGGCDIRCHDSACAHGCRRAIQTQRPGYPGYNNTLYPARVEADATARLADAVEKLADAISRFAALSGAQGEARASTGTPDEP